jgi:hypothetical protein
VRNKNKQDVKREGLREQLWPGSGQEIWDPTDSEKTVGFATVSRLLPLVNHLIRLLCKKKNISGDPTAAYLDLWCRDWGQGIITVTDENDFAYSSGYASTRAVRTWREHITHLVAFEFVRVKKDGNKEVGHVLLLNPLAVCAQHHAADSVPEEWWSAFVRRAKEIGATMPNAHGKSNE